MKLIISVSPISSQTLLVTVMFCCLINQRYKLYSGMNDNFCLEHRFSARTSLIILKVQKKTQIGSFLISHSPPFTSSPSEHRTHLRRPYKHKETCITNYCTS